MRKNNDNYDIDKKIKEYLFSESQNIHASEYMFPKIKNEILSRNERGFLNMKIGILKVKTALIAAGLCIVTTASVGAATNKLIWSGSSNRLNEVTKYPTEDKVKDTVGFTPKYVESFDNGFKFESFNFSDDKLQYEGGNTVLNSRNAEFEYTRNGKEKNKYLNMNAQKIEEKYFNSDESKSKMEATDYDGIKIYYHSFKYKAVPEGYTPTEEENDLVEKGDLQIGYGAPEDEIEENNDQYVCWYEDGIGYSISNSNYDDLTKDQMIDMAKEVINK